MARKSVSLSQRVRAVIMLATVIVLLATTATFAVLEIVSFRAQVVRNLSTLAAVVADNSRFALAIDSKPGAVDVLAALRAEPDILAAALYDGKGALFASYPELVSPELLPRKLRDNGHHFTQGDLIIFETVFQEGKPVGTLYIRSSLRGVYSRFWNYGLINIIVLAVSLAGAYALSTLLQRRISKPILELTQTTSAIAERGDYSMRASKMTEDEVGVLTDSFNRMIGQIQQSEQALREHQQRLERTVEERTAALRETVQQLETFSYSIVHDMRAPLRTMRSFAGFLNDEEGRNLTPQGRDYLNRIMLGAERLDALINDVLTYSRVSKGEASLQVVPLDRLVADLLREYPDLHAHAANIEVRPPLPRVIGNPALLTQCISNLVGNALKFVPKDRPPRVVVRSEEIGHKVRLWVEDNGIGIPAEQRDKLFGLFERLHVSREYAGTGIGLAIVKRAVERMNGAIGFDSEVGKGSRFWLELPRG